MGKVLQTLDAASEPSAGQGVLCVSALKDTRCAVLGAGGFLGTTLCQRLRAKQPRCARSGRQSPDALRGIEWLTGDFADIQHVKEAIRGCDTVFHLANATTPASANQDKIADLQSNVASTLGLLDACRDLASSALSSFRRAARSTVA